MFVVRDILFSVTCNFCYTNDRLYDRFNEDKEFYSKLVLKPQNILSLCMTEYRIYIYKYHPYKQKKYFPLNYVNIPNFIFLLF